MTLAFSRALRDALVASGRYKVHMTRDSDRFIRLRDRVRFARNKNADLFISIHVNSLPLEAVNIVETFYFGSQNDRRVLELAVPHVPDPDLVAHGLVGPVDGPVGDAVGEEPVPDA